MTAANSAAKSSIPWRRDGPPRPSSASTAANSSNNESVSPVFDCGDASPSCSRVIISSAASQRAV